MEGTPGDSGIPPLQQSGLLWGLEWVQRGLHEPSSPGLSNERLGQRRFETSNVPALTFHESLCFTIPKRWINVERVTLYSRVLKPKDIIQLLFVIDFFKRLASTLNNN